MRLSCGRPGAGGHCPHPGEACSSLRPLLPGQAAMTKICMSCRLKLRGGTSRAWRKKNLRECRPPDLQPLGERFVGVRKGLVGIGSYTKNLYPNGLVSCYTAQAHAPAISKDTPAQPGGSWQRSSGHSASLPPRSISLMVRCTSICSHNGRMGECDAECSSTG